VRRATWTEDGLEIVEVEPPPLTDGWVRLKVEACGICGSDLHFWHGHLPRPIGTAPGHEFVGTVIDGPAGLPDARYAVSPNVCCGRCDFCTTGRTNLCRRGGYGIGLGRDGALADFVDAPAVNLAPVPDGVDAVTASFTEPLAVSVRGVGLANLATDTTVLVLGGGMIGLCAALIARARAGLVAITARHPHQQAAAEQLGVTVLVLGGGMIGLCAALIARARAGLVAITARHPHQQAAAEQLGVTVLREGDVLPWAKDHRPDVVIETVGGAADTIDDAIRAVRRGGRVVVVGSFGAPKPVDLQTLMMKEIALLGSFCYGTGDREPEFATAARLTGRWRTDLQALATHQFGLGDVAHAFETASDKTTGAIKVTIVP
jgi:threonine dehydrogenase-like Zn-dependent dehydrogenase